MCPAQNSLENYVVNMVVGGNYGNDDDDDNDVLFLFAIQTEIHCDLYDVSVSVLSSECRVKITMNFNATSSGLCKHNTEHAHRASAIAVVVMVISCRFETYTNYQSSVNEHTNDAVQLKQERLHNTYYIRTNERNCFACLNHHRNQRNKCK